MGHALLPPHAARVTPDVVAAPHRLRRRSDRGPVPRVDQNHIQADRLASESRARTRPSCLRELMSE
jgi:hypothetical protein